MAVCFGIGRRTLTAFGPPARLVAVLLGFVVALTSCAATSEPLPSASAPVDLAATSIEREDCADAAATGRWRTAESCDGTWEIVNPDGEIVHFNAVNVRAYSLADNPLDANDLARLKERFDYVRLNLSWALLDPNGNELDAAHRAEVEAVLDRAADAGLGIILDVVHLGNIPGPGVFGIPAWAWPEDVDPKAQTSFEAWAGDNGANVGSYLDRLAAAGLLTHPSVVAVEVVNEPHPTPGLSATSEEAQVALAATYEALRARIQFTQDQLGAPTRLVIMGAYYGGTRFGGEWDGNIDGSFSHNAIADLVDNTDTVWTAHSYFTGLGDDDGHGDDGRQGEGVWSESWHSAGCYGTDRVIAVEEQDAPWVCPEVTQRDVAYEALRRDVLGHWSFAQDADRPFFLGEWGVPRQRYQTVSATDAGRPVGPYRGWANADLLFCDRLAALDDVTGLGHATSWGVWSFDGAPDSFGLYLSRAIGNPQDNSDKVDLPGDSWVDQGTFSSATGGWAGATWTYASPFSPDAGVAEASCTNQ